MLDAAIRVFLATAQQGSFTKAAEALYLSPTAIMKQINLLEEHLGLRLFERSARGVRLTEAGRSLETDARRLLALWDQAVEQARFAQAGGQHRIRVGTSALYPCTELISLWSGVSGSAAFLFQIVPFEDASTAVIRRELGKQFDVMVGPFDSRLTGEYCRLLPLGSYAFSVAMPREHPLAGRNCLRMVDLAGQRVMIQKSGNSRVNDAIRAELERVSPTARIVDAPYHYDLEVFNRCQAEGCLLIIPDCWRRVHPSLTAVPLETVQRLPYGVLYSAHPGAGVTAFIESLAACLRKTESACP